MLGTGAQKAGTTWLADYLRRSPQYEPGYRKEYHVFDSLDLASEEWMRRRIIRLATRSLESASAGETADAEVLHRMAMYADLDYYYDYFASLVARSPDVIATGDLTPDYALLSAERLADIRRQFGERGMRTVAVFLLRDPVERVWSHIRMKAHRHPRQFERSSEDELLHAHAESSYAIRTQYHQTLDALAASFPDEDVHVGLYEQLFTDQTQVHAISGLIGIDARPARFGKLKNASPRSVEGLPESTARTVAEFYADTYRGVAARRPDLDLERWWPHARHVL